MRIILLFLVHGLKQDESLVTANLLSRAESQAGSRGKKGATEVASAAAPYI